MSRNSENSCSRKRSYLRIKHDKNEIMSHSLRQNGVTNHKIELDSIPILNFEIYLAQRPCSISERVYSVACHKEALCFLVKLTTSNEIEAAVVQP